MPDCSIIRIKCLYFIAIFSILFSAHLSPGFPTDATHGRNSANPDDDAETVDVIPSEPEIPKPDVNVEPDLVLVPLHPGYGGYGGYDGYGGFGSVQPPSFWSYFPINPYSWNLNYFTGKLNCLLWLHWSFFSIDRTDRKREQNKKSFWSCIHLGA